MIRKLGSVLRIRSAFHLGAAVIAAVSVLGVLVVYKPQLTVALKSGETLTVRLAENYGVRAYATDVKIAGISVGDVTAVDRVQAGGVAVTVKIGESEYEKLRSAPSAHVRPATLLGGNFYLDLVPGGQPGRFSGAIPVDRTSVPVELDKIARALQPDVLASMQGTVRQLDEALGADSRQALRRLLKTAPGTLEPAGEVLAAARGTRPQVDLPKVVTGLESTASALNKPDEVLSSIIVDLDTTSGLLAARSGDLVQALRKMPATLDSANAGLTTLNTTLDKLGATAGPLRPVARDLDATLRTLDPVLVKARPLVATLSDALDDVRPLVADLDPVARDATTVLGDLKGPVLDRVNGPVLTTVRAPWRGSGPYEGGGGDYPMYQALAYALSGLSSAISPTDPNGSQFDMLATGGPESAVGLPVGLERILRVLANEAGGGR